MGYEPVMAAEPRERVIVCGADAGEPHRRIEVGRDLVCIRRRIAGLETRVNVPTSSYRGVTLRMTAGGQFEVALLHGDPSLDLVLARAPDDSDVIALWRRYGRMIGLRLLVEDAGGSLQPLDDGAPTVRAVRRSGSPLRSRRPRFLARRATGRAGAQLIHRGERALTAMM
jgi:Family of unknown function (DUF6101)